MRKILLAATAIAAIGALSAAALAGFSYSHHSDDEQNIIISQSGDDGTGAFIVQNRDVDLVAKWKGDFDFSADGRSVTKVNGSLEIQDQKDSKKKTVTFTGGGSTIETEYRVGNQKQPLNEKTKAEIAGLVLTFVRASGFQADERVALMLKNGGVAAVMEEIDVLTGDYSAMKYIAALSDQAELNTAQIESLADRISGFDGDHGIRVALESLFMQKNLTADSRAVLLRAAEGIEGDHDLRLLLETVASGEMNKAALNTALVLLGRIEGDHDTRLASEALLGNKSFTDEDAARLLEIASAQIEGDHDLRLLIEATAGRIAKSDAIAAASIRAGTVISSDHDKRLTIETIASALPKASTRWKALLEAVSGVSSDHDRRLALEALAGLMPESPDLVAAYRSAAEGIGSDHDREGALAAIEGR